MNKLGKFAALLTAVTGLVYATKKIFGGSTSKTESASMKSGNLRGESPSNKSSSSLNHDTKNHESQNLDNLENEHTRNQKMFKELGMTEDQKKRYEADYKTLTDVWEKENPNMKMDNRIKGNNESATLNAVLNEDQFSMYRNWIKKYSS